jgi:hypothetical protein
MSYFDDPKLTDEAEMLITLKTKTDDDLSFTESDSGVSDNLKDILLEKQKKKEREDDEAKAEIIFSLIQEANRQIVEQVEGIRKLREQEKVKMKKLTLLTGTLELANQSGDYSSLLTAVKVIHYGLNFEIGDKTLKAAKAFKDKKENSKIKKS